MKCEVKTQIFKSQRIPQDQTSLQETVKKFFCQKINSAKGKYTSPKRNEGPQKWSIYVCIVFV